MEKRDFHIGPGAASLLLVIVVVSMSVLSLLALLNVRADTRITQRSLAIAEAQYVATAQAERDFAELDALSAGKEDFDLPEGYARDGQRVIWDVSADESVVLHCVASRDASGRLVWEEHSFVNCLDDAFALD